jgi:hypothetical protein
MNEGIVKCRIDRIYDQKTYVVLHTATTDGFVYLTDLVPLAVYYANAAHVSCKEASSLYLFEVEIDESELSADEDQIRVESVWDKRILLESGVYAWDYTLEKFHHAAVARDLTIPGDVVRYAVLPFVNNSDDPLHVIVLECIQHQYTNNDPIPSCIDEIPWISL